MTAEARAVQTVTGRVLPEVLGRTLIHEHVLIGMPGWNMDALAPRFDRAEAMARAIDQMQQLRDLGVGTFVDPCPMDLGRDVEFLAELSQRSGLQIVCTTGAYFEAEGVTHTFRQLPVEEITATYITVGRSSRGSGIPESAPGRSRSQPGRTGFRTTNGSSSRLGPVRPGRRACR